MIQVDKMKYLRKYTGQIIIPTNKEDIHKSSCVILLNRNKDSIFSVMNDSTIDDKNLFNFIYRSRDIEFFIKSDRIIEKGTTSRNEYYKDCRDGLKLTGIISISSLKERNFYFDTYFEHEAFINNSGGLTEINRCNEYLKLLKVHLIGFSVLENYKTKIVIMQLDDWRNAEINPLDMLHTACLKSFDSFKEIGDIDFIFFTNKTIFKMNPSKITVSDRTKFSTMCQDLKNAMGESNDILNSEMVMDDEDETEEDEAAAEKIRQQEEKLSEEDIEEDEEEVKKIADKVMEPVIIKKDAISKRDAELRERQKNLKVDGVKIGDLTEMHDKQKDYAELPVNDVSGSVNTLNRNVTKVQFASFTQAYNEQFYHRDIISITDALKDKSIPVFVRDAKREDTSDSLNQKYTYTFYLEDSNRGRHTLKFDMPKFVEGKYMYLNGHKKEFNNQRIAKPLIKTGPDTVQVVTNYNKIFMTRHGEKVEALYEKFKELVISDPKHFAYKRGDCSRLNTEYKTTIEYDTLAKHFAEIIVKPPEGPRLYLIFSQPKLKELCCQKLGLEKEWKNAQENNQLVAGYFEDSKKRSLYTIELKTQDITQIVPTKESVGNAFPADEYIDKEGVMETNNRYSTRANIIFSENDIYCNMEKFYRKEVNIVFVTGFSGSGKSTLARQFAVKNDAIYVELDALIYRGMRRAFDKEWCDDHRAEILWMYLQETKKPLDFMVKYKTEKNSPGIIKEARDYIKWLETKPTVPDRYIIEGVDLTRVIPSNPDWYSYPIIFKGTSATTSLVRKIRRDGLFGSADVSITDTVEHVKEMIGWYSQMLDQQSGLRSDMIKKDNHFEKDDSWIRKKISE